MAEFSAFNPGSYGGQVQPMSKFGEAIAQLIRLDFLWKKAELRATSGNLIGWKWVLDSVWRELYADALRCRRKGRNWDYWNKNIEQANRNISLYERQRNFGKLYSSLDIKHKILKDLQTEVGKGGKYSDHTEDDLD